MVEDNITQPLPQINQIHPINRPQRVELPVFFNTPGRFNLNCPYKKPRPGINKSFTNATVVDQEHKNSISRRLKDYTLLAYACKRGDKKSDEGRAYYSIGVLFDNLGQYTKAIQVYFKFLKVCNSIGDLNGKALAYNCIGVDYHLLAERDPRNKRLWNQAIRYYIKHLESSEASGQFVAHTNLGLIYSKLGNSEQAAEHHKLALKFAIEISNLEGQGVVIGNLSQIGKKKYTGDPDKLKTFAQRYLQISKQLKDKKGQGGAYQQLGNLSFELGELDQSAWNFRNAMKIASQIHDSKLMRSAQVKFGIASGTSKFGDKMQDILSNIKY